MAIEIIDSGTITGLRHAAEPVNNPRPLLIQVRQRANVELPNWFLARNQSSGPHQRSQGLGLLARYRLQYCRRDHPQRWPAQESGTKLG